MEKTSKTQKIRDSLKKFGLNPNQWSLGPQSDTGHPWVIIKNRQDPQYCMAGRLSPQGLRELHLLQL